MKRSRLLILHNPMAGQNGERLVHEVADALRERGAQADINVLDGNSNTAAFVANTYDAVVVSGGDGTIRALAERVEGEGIPLGIIPNGTGNVLAHEFGLSRNPTELANVLIEGRSVPVHGGTVNGILYLLMFGAGFDGRVVRRLSRRGVQRFGRLAYAWPILKTMAEAPAAFEVVLDGRHFVTSWLLIANASRYGGGFHLTNRTRVTDSSLVAFVSHAKSRRARFVELWQLIRGRLELAATMQVLPVRCAVVASPDVPAQIDGESLPGGPYNLEPRHKPSKFIATIQTEGVEGPAR